jgi:hypothetical protein
VVVAALGAASCSNSASSQVGLAASCALNSDCDQPLICVFSRCHTACHNSGDCPTGERCVSSAAGGGPSDNVCQLPSEIMCSATSSCQSGQVCGSDQQCRAQCTSTASCALGDFCLTSSAASACYSPSDSQDDPALVAAGVISPDGAVLSDGGIAVIPANDAASSSGSSGGGSGSSSGGDATVTSSGDAGVDGPVFVCNAIPLPDGACDYCPAGACNNRGTCVSGAGSYSCTCFSGYGHNASGDPTTCVVTDSCVANSVCTPAYPCVDTAPPGQACRGQYAAWHVTEQNAAPGSATEAPSYSNNGDGTITDNVTQLMWQVNVPAANSGCAVLPADAGIEASVPTTCTLADSLSYCAAFADGNYHDWRLPALIELESLLDFSAESTPYIASQFLPTVNGSYWTSSALENNSEQWFVDVSTTNTMSWNAFSANTSSVRCVRGVGIGPATPATHYTINPGAIDAGVGDAEVTGDTVTDNYTGLTWQRGIASSTMVESDAVSYCTALGNGFRLPTLKELVTLVDPILFSPSIDTTTVFPGTPAGQFWSSTAFVPANGDYYDAVFTYGYTRLDGANNSFYVRCVH